MRRSYVYFSFLSLFMFSVAACSGGGGGGVVIPTGSATLSWTAPTMNNDGSALALAGFEVHYGTSPGQYTGTVIVSSPTATTHTVTGLPLGATYYFVITAYNTSGAESAPSIEVNKKM
jgi:Fibronectin type III domain